MLIPRGKAATEHHPEPILRTPLSPCFLRKTATPEATGRETGHRLAVLVAAAHAAVGLAACMLAACSCPWSPPPPANDTITATLTWTGDADLDLELYRVTDDLPDSAPWSSLATLPLARSPSESVDGTIGETVSFDGTTPGDRFLLAVRFWSVGPDNHRQATATLRLDASNGGPSQFFTASLDDDSADLWLPAIIDRTGRRVVARGDTLVSGL